METMAALLTEITAVFTAGIGWVGTIASTVGGEPLLLIGVVTSFVGIAIGWFAHLRRGA